VLFARELPGVNGNERNAKTWPEPPLWPDERIHKLG